MAGSKTQLLDDILGDRRADLSDADAVLKAWEAASGDQRAELAKSTAGGSVDRVGFEARATGGVGALWKSDDDYVIWGPASVEVVDKENDRIEASALEDALPQLMKRQSLSFEHSDQIVGKVLDTFETDEPVEVQFGDTTVERSAFPTDVITHEGMDAPALFVAGNVYNDTQKSREVREAIDAGDIDSYSISGEAIVSSMSIEGGEPVTDISKLDLSAVTLCREGMNQMAKFGVVNKHLADAGEGQRATRLAFAKSAEGSDDGAGALTADAAERILKQHTPMSNGLTKSEMQELLDKNLPDGELATLEDVEKTVEQKLSEFGKENATNTEDETEGSTDRPSGDHDNPVEQDNDYAGDADVNPAEDSEKVEEKAVGMEQVKSILKDELPDDQYKAVEPLLGDDGEGGGGDDAMGGGGDDAMGGGEPASEPEPEPEPEVEETVEPEDEMLAEEKAKAIGLDPQTLSAEQKRALAKSSDGLDVVNGVSSVAKSEAADMALDQDGDDDDSIEKALDEAETATMAGSNFVGGDGTVNL
jgi:DNA-binding transcriptional MerR regulator